MPEGPRTPSPQDRALEQELTDMERSLEAARDDAEVQALLAPVGFDPAALDALLALVNATQERYKERAVAMGAEDAAVAAKNTRDAACRGDYATFRKIARPRFRRDPDALAALNLNGEVPDALGGFVTHARGAYANAALDPYAPLLLGRGYGAARLTALTKDLDALVDAAKGLTKAEARAVAATAARNTAYDDARRAFAEYRDTARPVLAGRPDLLDRLDL